MHQQNIISFIPSNKVYGAANITRPYISYKNRNEKEIGSRFNLLMKIWEKRDIVIVEGEYSKLGVGNDLFNNCKSINRIICPARNAFSKYEQICGSIRQQPKSKLILLALGPTATIVAYNMTLEGYQCVDIGHVDVEYLWFKSQSKRVEKIPGKYVQEAGGLLESNKFDESEYIEQIQLKIE